MKNTLAIIAIALLSVGCARFSTTQTEVRNGETTTITTKAQAWTFIQSKSSLANWKATQSEGNQGAEVGSLEQESDPTVMLDSLKELNQLITNVKP
jgi:hypothetical protein